LPAPKISAHKPRSSRRIYNNVLSLRFLFCLALLAAIPAGAQPSPVATSGNQSQTVAKPDSDYPPENPAIIEAAMRKYPPTERDVVYGTPGGETLRLDVFEPGNTAKKLRKAIILIHGGSWDGYDKTILAPLAHYLQHHGFVVFSINYRLVTDTSDRWPTQLDDAQRAVRWVRAHAQQYNIDPAHIGAVGHSAGGQIAAFLGEQDTRDNSDPALAAYSSKVQAVVDASGPTDFLAFRLPSGNRILTKLMGVSGEDDPRAWEAASPIWNVTPQTAPFLVVHGKHDHTVYITQAVTFVDELKQKGVPVKFVKTNDGHIYSTFWSKYQLATNSVRFLRKTLGE
jgi:acetyl esterase/lipase